ncbi:splicing factor, Prp19-binding domain-containing protein [Umbelopsis sp. AD052]|nr:splicing factor, Prp19-binding domain-containing protein [Umbelopsis sp. AD052]
MSAPRSNPRLPAPVKRYRAGQAPTNVQESSDEEEDDEEQQQQQQETTSISRRDHASQAIQFAQKEVITGVEQVAISDQDAASDRRLRRLKEAQAARVDESGRRRRRFEEDEPAQEESEDEDEIAAQRQRMKQKALEQRKAQEAEASRLQEAMPIEEEDEEEEEEGSTEYETDSSEEYVAPKLIKPVFIPKDRRATVMEKERIAEAEEAAEQQRLERLEQRKLESHQLLADQLKKDIMGEEIDPDSAAGPPDVDDTDGVDEEAEFEAWKIRELLRIKRDKEERIARDREREEIERRREMPEEERLKEDLERARESRKKDRSKHQFMQKYYHKGAFYQDKDDEIFKRDYEVATESEINKKEMLPEVMQVKKFGMAGQTKYKHLAAEDTTDKTSAWMQKSDVNRRAMKRMGGMKDEYDHQNKRRR